MYTRQLDYFSVQFETCHNLGGALEIAQGDPKYQVSCHGNWSMSASVWSVSVSVWSISVSVWSISASAWSISASAWSISASVWSLSVAVRYLLSNC